MDRRRNANGTAKIQFSLWEVIMDIALRDRAGSSGRKRSRSSGRNRRTAAKRARVSVPLYVKLLIILGVLLACLGTAFLVVAGTYKDRFIEGTIINGINAGGKTAAEVESEIRERVENFSLTLTFRGGRQETVTGDEFGYAYAPSGGVQDLVDHQNRLGWLSGKMGEVHTFTVSEATTYSPEMLDARISSLPELQIGSQMAPTNAYLQIENNSFAIVGETQGSMLRYDVVLSSIEEAIASGTQSVDISANINAYEQPIVYADNPNLIAMRDELNAFLQTSITHTLKNGSKTLDASTLIGWISRDENGGYYLDDAVIRSNVNAYVAGLAAEVDSVKNTVSFQSTLSGVVEIGSAQGNGAQITTNGVQIDQAAEAEQLYNEIMGHTSTERPPIYSLDASLTPADLGIGNTYVELDLSKQHLFYYNNGQLVAESEIVTGSENSTPTPRGIYYLQNKETYVTMLGPLLQDGTTRSYYTLVKYWLPYDIDNGIGMHDATWRTTFGGDIYLENGSHGCVNLPEAVAAVLFEQLSVGTPVVVFG